MNSISQQLSYEASDSIGATATVNDTKPHLSSLPGRHFASGRNSASGVEQNLGRTEDSFLDDRAVGDNDLQTKVSGASPSSIRAGSAEKNHNQVETNDNTVDLSPHSQPHRNSLLGSKFLAPTVCRAPNPQVLSAVSGAQSSNPFYAALNSDRVHCASPTPTTEYNDIELKQNELRHAVENRIHSLEKALAMREEELLHLRTELRKMGEDYQFNYSLIAERDEALEESSRQQQRLYRELKQVTAEAAAMEGKLRAAERDVSQIRQRLRDVEADREAALRRVQKEYFVKEQHAQEAFKKKEAALEEERQRVHEHYMQKVREIEASRRAIEGDAANASSESAQRHEQAMARLQAEFEGSRKMLQSITEENAALTARARRAEEEVALLRKQLDLEAKQQDATMGEVVQTNRSLESQVAQLNLQLNQNLATAESTIREEAQKNNRLELEKTNLQTKLTEALSHVQQLLSQRQEEVSQYSAERQALQLNYQNAQREMEIARGRWREAEQRLQAALVSKQDELDHATWEKKEWERLQQVMQQQLREKERERAEYQQELAQLSEQVARWKAAESTTATRDRQETAELQEKILNLERVLQAARDETELSKRNALNVQERSQEEVARLARELHASEAARRALEDQFHRSQDHNAQETLLNSLRYEKEILEKRNLDLERTNSEIREQVANFTLELQNDPVVKSAREMHRRVDQLQQDLLESRDSNQQLQNLLKEKEEELARYQVDILRAQILLSNDGNFTDNPETLDSGFSGLVMQHRREWADLRTRLDSTDRVRRPNRSTRRHKTRLDASLRSRSSASNASDTSRSNGSLGKRKSCSKGRQGSPKKGKSNKGTTNHSVVSPSSPFPSPANAMNPVCLVSGEVLLKEAEVWRQKYYQLEQHLRKVLLERDHLSRELQLTKQDVAALSDEKQSLLDLNSLLKTQLREAYRIAYEANTTAKGPILSPTNAQLRVNSPEKQDAMTSMPGQPSTAACAPSQKQQDRKQSGAFSVGPRLQEGKFREENLRYTTLANAASEIKEQASGTGVTSENHIYEQACPSPALPAVGARCYDHQQERLKALEEEIRFVKNQISNTMHQHQPSRQQPTTMRNARRVLGGEEGASVVRKGGQAVRHYGHH